MWIPVYAERVENISTSFVASISLSLLYTAYVFLIKLASIFQKFSRETPNFRGRLGVHPQKFESSKWV